MMVGAVLAPSVEIPMSESGGPHESEDANAHLDQYRLRGILGNGSFGKVWACCLSCWISVVDHML